MSRLRATMSGTFTSLRVRNYRLYFVGQTVSVSGTWMQSVALVWLVLERLHGSALDVGLVTALQFLPMLVVGSWGGVVVDRLDKRALLYATQTAFLILALALGLLTLTGVIVLWQVYLLALLIGFVNLFDNPARQAFVPEMVGLDLLSNAVSLNSVVMNSARVIGPAVAGALLVTAGTAACFLANAGSFVAVIVALALMERAKLERAPRVARAKGQVREGLRYAWSNPVLRDILLMTAVIGLFTFNFTVSLSLLAKFTFHGGAATYSAFLAAMGAGAVLGGLSVARRAHPTPGNLATVGLVFGLLVGVVALAPSVTLAVVALVPMGATSIAFVAMANSALQLEAEPAMRGRVMALYSIAFMGSTPIGAPLVGAVSSAWSPRAALAMGALAAVVAAAPVAYASRRSARWAPQGVTQAVGAKALAFVTETPDPPGLSGSPGSEREDRVAAIGAAAIGVVGDREDPGSEAIVIAPAAGV